MKAAIVQEAGKNPIYADFQEPQAGPGQSKIKVSASALSHLTKGRASGAHYSSSAKFPFVAGVDGVGCLEDGRRVYFALPEFPFGGMAEQTSVRSAHFIPIPDDLDDVRAAALANPGMSSWAALKERARLLKGETVLINGATGISGSLAVQIAKHMGAKKVIATGRNPETLRSLRALGADVTLSLTQDSQQFDEALKELFSGDGVDVILDYLWGDSAAKLLLAAAKEGKDGVPIRFVQIGALSGSSISLPGSVLRSSALQLMGSGIGSVSLERLMSSIQEMFQAATPADFKIAVQTVGLDQVEQFWEKESSSRLVFTVRE